MSQTYASNDFNDILNSLVLYMKNQSEFKDMNFDGSAIRELLRVLAYNSQQQAFQNNFVYNELQLDTAQLRPNVTSIASRLGYTPSSKRAAKIGIKIVVTPPDLPSAPSSLLLSRDTQFYSTKDGQTYILSPETEYVVNLIDGKYTFNNVNLLQGIWTVNAYLVQTQYGAESYVIPNAGLDNDTLEVSVRTSETSGSPIIYNQFKTAYDLASDAKLYFLRENRDSLSEFKFGDNKFAVRLDYGNVITIRYLVTQGALGNNLTGITSASSIGGFFDVNISQLDLRTYGGADQEDIESIRTLAPISFAASGNAVTSGDYVGLTKKLFSEAGDVISWGGEDNITVKFGYTFVSVIPKNSDTLSSMQKAALTDILKQYNVGSITPVIVDPIYTYINVNSIVKYKVTALNISTSSLQNKISDYCKSFSKEKMEVFGGKLEMSKLSEFIDNIDVCIKGNSTQVVYEKRFVPTINTSQSYVINFDHKIKPGTILISNFKISDIDQSGSVYSIIDDGAGILKIIKVKSSVTTVMNSNVGNVNYETGNMNINSFRPSELTDFFVKVLCSSYIEDDQSMVGVRNSILKINEVNTTLLAVVK